MNMLSTVPDLLRPEAGSSDAHGVVVSCRGLKRSVGAQVILDVKELRLARGRVYLLSGPNGAGKTTLLRVIAGLERASCSEFQFDGKAIDLAQYPESVRRKIGFVHHHPLLFSTSVQANISYGLRAAGVARVESKRRTADAIEWPASVGWSTVRRGHCQRGRNSVSRWRVPMRLTPICIFLTSRPPTWMRTAGKWSPG